MHLRSSCKRGDEATSETWEKENLARLGPWLDMQGWRHLEPNSAHSSTSDTAKGYPVAWGSFSCRAAVLRTAPRCHLITLRPARHLPRFTVFPRLSSVSSHLPYTLKLSSGNFVFCWILLPHSRTTSSFSKGTWAPLEPVLSNFAPFPASCTSTKSSDHLQAALPPVKIPAPDLPASTSIPTHAKAAPLADGPPAQYRALLPGRPNSNGLPSTLPQPLLQHSLYNRVLFSG